MRRSSCSRRAVLVAVLALPGCERVITAPVEVSGVVVEPGEARLSEGESLAFTATLLGAEPEWLARATVVWSSDDPDVVRVEEDGSARALSPGTTTIRARFDTHAGSATVVVEPSDACTSADAPPEGKGKGKKGRNQGKNHDEDDDDDDDDGGWGWDDDEDEDDPRCVSADGAAPIVASLAGRAAPVARRR